MESAPIVEKKQRDRELSKLPVAISNSRFTMEYWRGEARGKRCTEQLDKVFNENCFVLGVSMCGVIMKFYYAGGERVMKK